MLQLNAISSARVVPHRSQARTRLGANGSMNGRRHQGLRCAFPLPLPLGRLARPPGTNASLAPCPLPMGRCAATRAWAHFLTGSLAMAVRAITMCKTSSTAPMSGRSTTAWPRTGLLRPDLLGRPCGLFWGEDPRECGHPSQHPDDARSRHRGKLFGKTHRPLVATVHCHDCDSHWLVAKKPNAAHVAHETDRPRF